MQHDVAATAVAPTTHEATQVVPGSVNSKEVTDREQGLYFQIPPAKSILEL